MLTGMLTGRKLALSLAFTVLVALATGVSCKGFFTNPTLSSVSVSPSSVNLDVNSTQQFTLWGTYSDGSRTEVTSGVTWTSDSTSVPITSGGKATGETVTSSSATITGYAQGLDGTASVTVIGDVTSMTVSPSSQNVKAGNSVYFTFAASPGPPYYVTTDNGGTLTITTSDSYLTCSSGVDSNNNPAEVCSLASGGTATSYTLQMSYPSPSGGYTYSPTATLTATQ
jgi:hypothetical protein